MLPRMLFLVLIGISGVPLVLGIWEPLAGQLGVLLTLLVVAAATLDLVLSQRPWRIEVRRVVPDVLSVDAETPVKLWVRNPTSAAITLDIHDEPPHPCTLMDLPVSVELKPHQAQEVVYHVKPHRRGPNRFGRVFLRSRSRLRFWDLTDERHVPCDVKIYPNVQAIQRIKLMTRRNRTADAGVRLSLLRGRGTEFDRLREYRREDEYRCIDWKATSRMRQLIAREYVVERNQNIVFLLDCGRSMQNEFAGVSHFDRAMNAAILLSYIALRQGDTVSWLAVSNRVHTAVPPLRGESSMRSLIRQTFDLDATPNVTDYRLMADQLRLHHRKRSLVVLLTHALDEVHLKHLGESLEQMKHPHLVLGAFLKNVPLHDRMTSYPQSDLEAFQVAAAASLLAGQSQLIAEFEQHGFLVINALPEELSSQLLSRYLDIKARHLL